MKNGLILSLGVVTGLVTAFDGGMILANQMVGDKQYSEAEFQEYGEQQREEGYNEGLTVNVGYSEEDLQNAYEQGIAEMEEILSVVGNKNIIYDNGNIELFTDGNRTIEGVFMHNFETNKYSKIISSGIDFDTYQTQHGGGLIIQVVGLTGGCYILDQTTYEIVTIEEEGLWKIYDSYEKNAIFVFARERYMPDDKENTAKGVKYINLDDYSVTEIMQEGIWELSGDKGNTYRILSQSSEVLGIYKFDEDSKELTTILTEGYGFDFDIWEPIVQGDLITMVSCEQGIGKINDDKTLTILLPTENGEKWQFDGSVAYNSTSMYYWNNTTDFEELELGVIPTQIVNLGYGYAVYNNEGKLVVVSPKFEVVTIETPGENIELQDGLNYDFNKSELLAFSTNGVLYKINLTSSQIDVVKDFGSGDIEIVANVNGAINSEPFVFLDVYDDGMQDLYGYKNGELTLFAEDCFSIYCEDTNDTTGTFVCQTSDGEERITIDYATFTVVE